MELLANYFRKHLRYMKPMLKRTWIILLAITAVACNKENPVIAPTVVTGEVPVVEAFAITGGGDVTAAGDSELLAIGLVASEQPGATVNSGIVGSATGVATGEFSAKITGLRSNTIYYVRAFATNKAGTAYGEEKMVRTLISIPTTLSFSVVTEISGYNFTQAIGFEGSKELQSLFIANRQIDTSVGIQYEHMFRYDLLNNAMTEIYNPIVDYISKEIQIIDNQPVVIGSQYVSTYEFDLAEAPVVAPHGLNLSRHGSALMNDEIYVYGGDLNHVDSDKIRKWNAGTGSWESVATMPSPKSYAGGEIVGAKLYVFGGQQEFSGTLQEDIIYVYSFADDSFATFYLPTALYRSYTAKVGELIYVAGHINPTGNDNTDLFFGVFDTRDNSFTEITINLSDANVNSIWAMTAIGNDLYVVYGDPVNDIEELSQEQTFTIQRAEIP